MLKKYYMQFNLMKNHNIISVDYKLDFLNGIEDVLGSFLHNKY